MSAGACSVTVMIILSVLALPDRQKRVPSLRLSFFCRTSVAGLIEVFSAAALSNHTRIAQRCPEIVAYRNGHFLFETMPQLSLFLGGWRGAKCRCCKLKQNEKLLKLCILLKLLTNFNKCRLARALLYRKVSTRSIEGCRRCRWKDGKREAGKGP